MSSWGRHDYQDIGESSPGTLEERRTQSGGDVGCEGVVKEYFAQQTDVLGPLLQGGLHKGS